MVNHPRRSRRATTSVAVAEPAHDHDTDYAALLEAMRGTFAQASRSPLFATDVEGLWEAYLGHLGAERQVHTCSACRRFVEAFGGLVTIADDGHAVSALWDVEGTPEFYHDAIRAILKLVARARVTAPFLSSLPVWGTPSTGPWTHFAVPSPSVHRDRLLTAGQVMAAKRENFGTVARALADFAPATIAEAVRLLEAGHLARSEQFIAPLHWLADLHDKRAAARDSRIRDNLLWRAIATAPEGYCHPRAAVTGTLLEDIAAGMAFADVKARFDAKMHPLLYQRPQAAPSAGNIAEAERVAEKLGIARSLDRRFARLDEVETAWTPMAPKGTPKPGGLFAHLSPKGVAEPRTLGAPAAVVTWEKFARTVLPGAEAIEARVTGGHMNFIALTTAEHADAPVIHKWGSPVAWYVYHGGSSAAQWRLAPGWVKVNAIVPLPPMWGAEPKPNLGEGFVLVLDGAADTRTGQGNALFPESLIGELHGIRASIEAYSKKAEIGGREAASACGLDVRNGAKGIDYTLRVTAGGLATEYRLDRWD